MKNEMQYASELAQVNKALLETTSQLLCRLRGGQRITDAEAALGRRLMAAERGRTAKLPHRTSRDYAVSGRFLDLLGNIEAEMNRRGL